MPPFSLKNATRTQISIRSSITIHFYTGVTPAAYRLDAFRINYRKGDLIGTYVYLAFQKPFRESPSSGTSHSRSRGQLHDRNGKMAATKILRSAGDATRFCARYHLPSSLDGAECHYDLQKQLTRRRPLPWHCQRHSLRHTGTLLVLPMRKHEKNRKILEATSLLSEMRPGLFLVIDIMLFGSDIYSLFPAVQHHGDPRHHLRHPLPSLHRRVHHLRLIPGCPSPITTFKHKKTPPCGRVFSFSGC